ncbi:unnamed protein product [Ascophyllum nodosum]
MILLTLYGCCSAVDAILWCSCSAPPNPSNERNALDPPSPELSFPRPDLSPCTLERKAAAQSDGGHQEAHDVIVEKSGRAWLFERKIMEAIFGEVWSAVEVERSERDQPYVIRYDEEGRTRRVAVKRMSKKEIEARRGMTVEDPMHEIAALAVLSDPGHPHVLQQVAALEDDDTVYLLTPFIDGGEMFAWVIQENNRFGRRRMETVRKLFRQLAEGMKYTHSKGICHADMSLENVLLDGSRENAYIIDFGMSLLMPFDDEHRRLKSVPDFRKAKTSYCSPETLKGKAYDGVKVDVFAAGAMLFWMLTGRPPFTKASRLYRDFKRLVCEGKVVEAIGRHRLELIPDGEEVAALLRGMMAYKPEDRPTPDEVLKHPWMVHGVRG